jgi:hypothetical protein
MMTNEDTHARGFNDQTVIAPPSAAPVTELAWSQAPDDPGPERRRSWRVVLMVAAGITVLGVCAAVVISVWPRTTTPGHPAQTTTSMAVPAPPAPPAPVPDSAGRPEDLRFLAMLARDGVPKPKSVPDEVAAAADVCLMIKRGDSFAYVESWLTPPHGDLTQNQAEAYVADAVAAYCPHAALGS